MCQVEVIKRYLDIFVASLGQELVEKKQEFIFLRMSITLGQWRLLLSLVFLSLMILESILVFPFNIRELQ